MNLIQIAGHLGQDPETRFTPNGQKVTVLRVATNIRRGGKEKTVWWKVTLWGDRFDRKLPYLKKGSPIFILGEMGIPEIYQDREGNNQISLEIIAEYIGFNPFGGKQDRAQQEGQEAMAEEAAAYAGSAVQTQAPRTGNQAQSRPQNSPKSTMTYGNAQDHSSGFEDDDIPF